ncbi:MAG: ATP-grasp domain-containing protein [Chloroflexota bacterium]
MLEPGGTIGMLGGGQLGRMTTMAARSMGYHVVVLDPSPNSPAGQVADRQIIACYDDPHAVAEFSEAADVVTLEFENLPVALVEQLAERVPTRPGAAVLRVCQNRLAERDILQRMGVPTGRYAPILDRESLAAARTEMTFPALLKTATLGYDSKGQRRVENGSGLSAAHADLGGVPCILEELLAFEREISVIVARDVVGSTATYEPA